MAAAARFSWFFAFAFSLILGAGAEAVAPSEVTLTVTPYNATTNQWVFSVKSGNPAVPYEGTLAYTTKNAADFKLLNEPIKAGTLKARIVYVQRPSATGGRVTVSAVELGVADKTGKFASLTSLKAFGVWDYKNPSPDKPVKAQLIDAVAVQPGLNTMAWMDQGYWMAKTPVTQELYNLVMGNNPSTFQKGAEASQRPVETVTYFEATQFCNRLSVIEGLDPVYNDFNVDSWDQPGTHVVGDFTKNGWRLPMDEEYYFAASGGILTKHYPFVGGTDPLALAWCAENAGGTTHPVGTKKPNELGLYDMVGNVATWLNNHYLGELGMGGQGISGPANNLRAGVRDPNRGSQDPRNAKSWVGIRLVRNQETNPSFAPVPVLLPPLTSGMTVLGVDKLSVDRVDWDHWVSEPYGDLKLTVRSLDPSLPFVMNWETEPSALEVQRYEALQKANLLKVRGVISLEPVDDHQSRVVLHGLELGTVAADGSYVPLIGSFDPSGRHKFEPKRFGLKNILPVRTVSGSWSVPGFLVSKEPIAFGMNRMVIESMDRWEDWHQETDTSQPTLTEPKINVSWFDAIDFCNQLSRIDGLEPVYTKKLGPASSYSKTRNLSTTTKEVFEVSSDASKSGWRLPTAEEALLAGGSPVEEWLSDVHLTQGLEFRDSLGPDKKQTVRYATNKGPGIGFRVVRRDPANQGNPKASWAVPTELPFSAQTWFTLTNVQTGTSAFLSLSADGKSVQFTSDLRAEGAYWRLRSTFKNVGWVSLMARPTSESVYLNPPPRHGAPLVLGPTLVAWRLTPLPQNTYRITSDVEGPGMSLQTVPGKETPEMLPTADTPAQLWRITPVTPPADLKIFSYVEPEEVSAIRTLKKDGFWMATDDGRLYQKEGDDPNWVRIPGTGVDFGPGPKGVLNLVTQEAIPGGFLLNHLNLNTYDDWDWQDKAGTVAVTQTDDRIWRINSKHEVSWKKEWKPWSKPLAGVQATDISSAPDGTVWLVGTKPAPGGFQIFQQTNGQFVPMEAGAVKIAIDPQGLPWVVTDKNEIRHFNGKTWDLIPGSARDISVSEKGVVAIVGTEPAKGGFDLKVWNGKAWDSLGVGGVAVCAIVAHHY